MKNWLADLIATPKRAALPILTTPGIPLTGASPIETFKSGELQFQVSRKLCEKFPTAAALTMMDLSVEAEAFGSPIQFSEKENPNVAGILVHDAAEIEQLSIPKAGTARTAECLLAAKLLSTEIKDRPTLGGIIGPFSLAGRLFDMSKMMLYTAMEPDMVHALLGKVTQFLVEYAKAFKATGCHGLIMAEPAAGLVSPKMSQEFSANYIKQVVDAVKDDSFTFILHNCGKTEKMVPALLSTGAHALHVGSAVEITNVLEQVPQDIPVMGNLDPSGVFLLGTAEEVFYKALQLLKSTSGFPNYVLSSGCDVPSGTPLSNVKAFFAALEEYNHSTLTG